jgi:hypothetical protein
MGYSRSSLYVGPARCVFNGVSFYSRGNASLAVDRETFKVGSDAFGDFSTRSKDVMVKCGVTPDGIWAAGALPKIWPYGSTIPGTNIHGATDVPLVLHTSASELWTVVAAAITKLPDIFLGNSKTMMGAMEFTGVRKDASDFETADSLYTFASTGGAFADATYASSALKVQTYTGVWAVVDGFHDFHTQDGWTISFDLGVDPVPLESIGSVMHLFQRVGVMAKCKPLGPTPAQIIAAQKIQGDGALGHGEELGQGDLVITGKDASTVITLKNAGLVTAGYQFGTNVLRQGELGWVANRSVALGTLGALWTLAA